MNRKIKFYLYILGFLWLGAAAEAYVSVVDGYFGQNIEAVLMEEDYMGPLGGETFLLAEEYVGRLGEEELLQLATELFAEKKAETIESISADGMFSAYGYSPLIKDYVVSGGKRINLNLVASYEEESDRTKIILATPIYNEDY